MKLILKANCQLIKNTFFQIPFDVDSSKYKEKGFVFRSITSIVFTTCVQGHVNDVLVHCTVVPETRDDDTNAPVMTSDGTYGLCCEGERLHN